MTRLKADPALALVELGLVVGMLAAIAGTSLAVLLVLA